METKRCLCKSPWYVLLMGKEGHEVIIREEMFEVYSLRLFRWRKLVSTFSVTDVVQVRNIENLVLTDTVIALTENRFCSLRHLRPKEAFGFKSYLAMLL
ncbi:hypothetical protein SKC37_09505 [Aquirufa sp. HETE-83D]|uniref:LytTR family transcriptional regulator n=1 Tax=Aquirufa esocilacus TaxID=3096513 RepID=A0ABW6DMZ3_9BACT